MNSEPLAGVSIRAFGALTWQAVVLGWRSSRLLSVVAAGAMAVASATPAVAAWSSKLLVDGVSDSSASPRLLVGLAVAVVLLTGVGAVLGYASSLADAARQRAVALHAEAALYGAVNRQLGLARIENPDFQDRLRLAQQSATDAPNAVNGFLLAVIRTIVTVGGFLGVLIAVWWPMAILLALALLPTLWGQLRLTRLEAATVEATVSVQRRRFSYQSLLTNPTAVKEVRLFGLGSLFRDRILSGLAEASGRELAVARRTAAMQSLFVLLSAAIATVGAAMVAVRASQGLASAGDVVLFVTATIGIQGAFNGTIGQLGAMVAAVRMFYHFRAVVTDPPDLCDGERDPGPLTDAIEFRDVWFRYSPASDWVLRGVNLRIPAGAAVALVGVNGAGKSTLVKLLCRFYDPERGRITWDGVDLRQLRASTLRSRIGVTFQDYMTYDLTAAENIGVGAVAHLADRARIQAAARMAGADELIEALPRGYDTLISRIFFDGGQRDQGVALSGGQGQRVALARSLMRADADLLVLDEPSAGLDALAEARLHRTMREHARGRTTLLISHRLNAIRDADAIVVLEDGRRAEFGAHDELMAGGGLYASMFSAQASGYQDDLVRRQVGVPGARAGEPPLAPSGSGAAVPIRVMPGDMRTLPRSPESEMG
ncbi:ABC transporter ATP-binding protein/permease [Micromonospora sp. NBC_00898]|uniref:ABC transporter ATP-binding protein n=1 Tax=Micromonospora sp. NBC_00898 TaxID=2975981 RepID=UPI003868B5E2|nr:ABC transporter ATP-binding protein/permease [Micromonospora sp. NBC_00898]